LVSGEKGDQLPVKNSRKMLLLCLCKNMYLKSAKVVCICSWSIIITVIITVWFYAFDVVSKGLLFYLLV